MGNLLFIINPIAGGGKAKSLEATIIEKMEEYQANFDIIFTKKEKHAIEIAENSKHETIVAVGGDGTVNEVARGIYRRGYGTMGIIPGGTGNDISRSLLIPKKAEEAIDILVKGQVKEIDVGIVNNKKFFNIASAGFDGEVAENTNRIKEKHNYLGGSKAYILGVLKTLLTYKRKSVDIEINGERYLRNLVLIAVGNGMYYGGGMKVLPQAKMEDGYLHICLVKDASNLTLLRIFPTIFSGNHVKATKYVELFKAREVKILSKDNLTINFDGETLSNLKAVEFKLAEEKLRLICQD